jgi:hypothetical protein
MTENSILKWSRPVDSVMAERLESGDNGDTPQLAELEGVSNVLLLSPSIGRAKSETCHELLTQTDPASTNVLAITFTKTPAEWVAEWNDHAGIAPARGGIVSVGEPAASVDDPSWAVKTVENPSDLTGIGIKLSELLSGIATAAERRDEPIVVCFDSITSLLQYADLQRTFRFLHVVTGRVKSVGGIGHYHVDPDAHGTQDLATLKGLFDAVVEATEDGEVSIQR